MNKTKTLFAFSLLLAAFAIVSPQVNAWPFRNKCCDPCDPCCGSGKTEHYEKKAETTPKKETIQTAPAEEIQVTTTTTSSEPQELVIPQDQGIQTKQTETFSIPQDQGTTSSTVETTKTNNYYPGLW